MKACSITQAIC